MERECQNCSYWERYREGNDVGHCRRYAPRPGESGNWPQTRQRDWCGEFERKADETD